MFKNIHSKPFYQNFLSSLLTQWYTMSAVLGLITLVDTRCDRLSYFVNSFENFCLFKILIFYYCLTGGKAVSTSLYGLTSLLFSVYITLSVSCTDMFWILNKKSEYSILRVI